MSQSLLQHIYLFEDFSEAELAQVEKLCQKRIVDTGSEVFSEGDNASHMYVIAFGTVNIRLEHDGGQMLVTPLGTGAHFGEMALIDRKKRSASAIAGERSELLEIPFDGLLQLIDSEPEIGVKFYRSLSRFLSTRLRESMTKLNFALGIHH